MAKIINNFVIDHVLRGIMVKKTGEYMWSVNQITEPSLNVTLTDAAQAVDALGTPIAEFDRGRSAEFTAQNSLWDLGLYAAQMGKDKEIASSTSKLVCPSFETIEVKGTDSEKYTLKNKPLVDITTIYYLNGDDTLGTEYKNGSDASATDFVYTSASQEITLPTGLVAGDRLFVFYEYETEQAVGVTADAINFPKRGKFMMEVLGCDVCDQENLIHAYVIFPNAKLDGNVDYSFATDGTHPFTIRAMQDYCDKEKKLFTIIIPDEE